MVECMNLCSKPTGTVLKLEAEWSTLRHKVIDLAILHGIHHVGCDQLPELTQGFVLGMPFDYKVRPQTDTHEPTIWPFLDVSSKDVRCCLGHRNLAQRMLSERLGRAAPLHQA